MMLGSAEHAWIIRDRVSVFVDPYIFPILIAVAWLGLSFIVFLKIEDSARSLAQLLPLSLFTTLPLPILAFWHSLGVPPITADHAILGVELYYVCALVSFAGSLLISIRLIEFPKSSPRIRRWGGQIFPLLSSAFFLFLPMVWTVVDARLRFGAVQSVAVEPLSCATPGNVLLAHISDVHLSTDTKTRDSRTPGNPRLITLLTRIREVQPEYLVISGDITDTGDADQWSFLRTAVDTHLPRTKLILSSENHDLNLFFGEDVSLSELKDEDADELFKMHTMPRLARFFLIQSLYMPMIRTSQNSTVQDLIRDAPTRTNMSTNPLVKQFVSKCRVRHIGEPWQARFACEYRTSRDWRAARLYYYSTLKQMFPLPSPT
jgi:hypothetical protein